MPFFEILININVVVIQHAIMYKDFFLSLRHDQYTIHKHNNTFNIQNKHSSMFDVLKDQQ